MEQSEQWAPTSAIAKRVREIRKRRGLTAEQLADRLAERGVSWQRSTVAKLENGNRENITLVEWLALAYVLDVAPVHLLIPTDDETPYQVTPEGEDAEQPAGQVRDWVRGDEALPGTDLRRFYSEVPEHEFVRVSPYAGEAFKQGRAVVTGRRAQRLTYRERQEQEQERDSDG